MSNRVIPKTAAPLLPTLLQCTSSSHQSRSSSPVDASLPPPAAVITLPVAAEAAAAARTTAAGARADADTTALGSEEGRRPGNGKRSTNVRIARAAIRLSAPATPPSPPLPRALASVSQTPSSEMPIPMLPPLAAAVAGPLPPPSLPTPLLQNPDGPAE